MSTQKNERQKIDLLISLSSAGSVQDEAAAFLATDTSEVVLRPALAKRILRRIRQNKHTTVKIAVAIALAAALLALSACACIPDVCEYFWKIVTTDRGDYSEIHFESAEKTDAPETDAATESLSETDEAQTSQEQTMQEQTTDMPPAPEIEHKPIFDPLPTKYVLADEVAVSSQYLANYNLSDGRWGFVILLYLADATHSFIDTEGNVLMYAEVHGNEAIVVEEVADGVKYYMVVWREGAYAFTLQGMFETATEAISLAELIKLVPNQ